MLLLTTATDFLELQSGSPVSTDWTASWVDTNYAAGQLVPGSAQGNVTTAGTIVIVGAPAAGFERQLKYLSVVNRDPLLLQTAIVDKNSGGVAASLTGPIALSPGDSLQYVDSRGFSVLTAQGQEKFVGLPGTQGVPGPAGVTFFLDGDPGEDGASTPGAAGAPGPTGPAGPAGFGPPGLDGDAGEDAMHIPGSQGVPGAAGAVGPAGPATFLEADAGETGDVGPPGIQGLQGVAGSTGSQGPVGPAVFLEADAGDEGPAGPPGAAGGAGPAGSTGAPGPTGPAVFLEADVIEGEAGAPGVQGPAGAPGAQGPFGYLVLVDDTPGDDGQPGPPGAPGSQGAAGATGLTGGSGFEILYHEIQAEDQWPQGVPYDVGAREYAGPVKFATGTTTLYPTIYVAGSNLTTPLAGVTEYDGTVKYFTPAASSRAVDMVEYFCCLAAAFTLTSQTAAQKLFNSTANGALTLPIGTYEFECQFELTGMSTVTGGFGFAFGGAATFTQGWSAVAVNAVPGTASNAQMTYNTAANTAIGTASTAGSAHAMIKGILRVTVAGTIIPQVSLITAAAAVVSINSYFRCSPMGAAAVATVGNWS